MLGHNKVIGCERLHFKSISSTNDHLNKLLAKTTPTEGTVISTSYQTNGKGQIGRYWYSADNKNLMFSTVVYPIFLSAASQFQLSMMTALGITDYLKEKKIPHITIKWPNDVYINNDKCSGILIQNQLSGKMINSSVIGIGLNLNQIIWPNQLPNPISLRQVTQHKYDHDEEITRLLNCIDRRYNQLRLGKKFYDEYNSHLYRKNVDSQFLINNQIISGKILNVNNLGQIRIDISGTINVFSFREIQFIL